MVNTRAQCEAFVGPAAIRPEGYRSVGPLRASLDGGADYVKPRPSETVLTIAMIETREAIENVEAIVATPGLDAVYVGPSDLSVSMGQNAGFDPEFTEVLAAILKVAPAAQKPRRDPGHPCRLCRLWQAHVRRRLPLRLLSQRFPLPAMDHLARRAGDACRHPEPQYALTPWRLGQHRLWARGPGRR